MRLLLPLFFLLGLVSPAFTQENADSAWIVDNYTKVEQMIPMRDGIKLFTSIYLPKDKTENHPILMTRTPYSCMPYGEGKFRGFWWNHYKHYLRAGYIMVIQDVRGRWMSEGEFVDIRPYIPNKKNKNEIDEASDTYDTIDWLINNLPNNNGKVGVFGISYPGFYSTMAALSGHPALKAVSPQAPVTDWFIGDDFHHNGAFFQMDGFSFYSGFGKPRPKPTTIGPAGFDYPIYDNYEFYMRAGSTKGLATLMGDSIKMWKDIYAHPDMDEWWKSRNVRQYLTDIKPAMLVVGGLFDAEDCYGAWRTYEAIEKKSTSSNNKIVMGPWYHGQWASTDGSRLGNVWFESNTSLWYQNHIEMPFFRYHLEGRGDISAISEASIFFTGENKWRQLPQWPVAGKEDRKLYLQPGGGLSWNIPAASGGSSDYISDPAKPVPYTEDVHFDRTISYMTDDQRFAARRPDVLVFQTEILNEDVTVAGTLIADLLTSISTSDADFVVKLIDVFPDKFQYPKGSGMKDYPYGGYQMLVRGEVMRGRYRNSHEKPQAFKPNSVERVRYELPDVAHTFQKGHRIMVQIQSSWFPLVDRNPQQFINIYQAEPKDYIKSAIRIHHDSKNASSITLPILK